MNVLVPLRNLDFDSLWIMTDSSRAKWLDLKVCVVRSKSLTYLPSKFWLAGLVASSLVSSPV